MTNKQESIIAYKGFDADWKCRDFQFAIGKTYTHDGEVKLCSSGFHACEYPLDCFDYYPPTGKFALVELIGASHEQGNDTKRVARSVVIKSEISIAEIVSAAVEYIAQRCSPAPTGASSVTGDQSASSATGNRSASSASGYQSASIATGYRSASSVTGDQSASSVTGDQSASSATGNRSASSASGYRSASSASGYQSASSATGNRSASSASGYRSASSASGYQSASSVTGDQSASSATGCWSASIATGCWSASIATGDRSASSATGNWSASSASGYQSASSVTGDQSASSVSGENSVAMNIGFAGKAKAGAGGAIVLCYHDSDGRMRHIRASKVGENGIKPDTFYVLDEHGEFREVE